MARIVFPRRFSDWALLFKNVKAKHDADGVSSPLIIYLNQNEIDLTDDENNMADAVAADDLFSQAEKKSEELSEKRNHIFKPVLKDHRGCVQFLKKFYANNNRQLGEWGVTVNKGARIVYANNFLGKKDDVLRFINKHDSFAPGTSPLQPFLDQNSIDLAVNHTAANDAQAVDDNFQSARREKEKQRAERNLLLKPIREHLRGIGGYLVKLFPDNPHKAGNWSFVIDSSSQKPKPKNFSVPAGGQKTKYNVRIGSRLLNKGPGSIEIFPRKGIHATSVSVAAREQFIIVRGFGIFTIKNNDQQSKTVISITN